MNTDGYVLIDGFPDYMINDKGKIISFRRKNPVYIKGKISQGGYHVVGLRSEEGVRKHLLVHRLVALAFLKNDKKMPVINHINGDKLDNRVENLEWCDMSHNTQHAYDNGYCVGTTKEVKLYIKGELIEIFDKKKDCVEYLIDRTGYSFDHIRKVISGSKKRGPNSKLNKYSFIVE